MKWQSYVILSWCWLAVIGCGDSDTDSSPEDNSSDNQSDISVAPADESDPVDLEDFPDDAPGELPPDIFDDDSSDEASQAACVTQDDCNAGMVCKQGLCQKKSPLGLQQCLDYDGYTLYDVEKGTCQVLNSPYTGLSIPIEDLVLGLVEMGMAECAKTGQVLDLDTGQCRADVFKLMGRTYHLEIPSVGLKSTIVMEPNSHKVSGSGTVQGKNSFGIIGSLNYKDGHYQIVASSNDGGSLLELTMVYDGGASPGAFQASYNIDWQGTSYSGYASASPVATSGEE